MNVAVCNVLKLDPCDNVNASVRRSTIIGCGWMSGMSEAVIDLAIKLANGREYAFICC